VDVWQKFPQPAGVPLPPGITWAQLSGVFPNTPAGTATHTVNADGNQAAYLFAIPGVGLLQSLNTSYEAGMAYQLTLGVLGGGGITEGSTLQIGLAYRDGSLPPVTIGSTSITFTSAQFPDATRLFDYSVNLPTVQAGDPWAGRNIEVQLLATGGTGAGYWDLDNVRLSGVPEPSTWALLALGVTGLAWVGQRNRRA